MGELRRITEQYRLDKLVHSSGAGSVFCATDLRSGEIVAVKLIGEVDEKSDEQREAFEQLARALRGLHHPGVPWTLDFGFTTAGSAFLVTEYCNGVSLEHFEGSAAERVMTLLVQVADALAALAACGVRHGNLRADNVLVLPGSAGPGGDPTEDVERIKLLGLGGAAALAPAAADAEAGDRRALAELTCRLLGASYDAAAAAPQVTMPPGAARLVDPAALETWLEAALRRSSQGTEPLQAAVDVFRRALGPARPEAPPGPPAEPAPERAAVGLPRSSAPAGTIERTVVLGGPALRLAVEPQARGTTSRQSRRPPAEARPVALPAGEPAVDLEPRAHAPQSRGGTTPIPVPAEASVARRPIEGTLRLSAIPLPDLAAVIEQAGVPPPPEQPARNRPRTETFALHLPPPATPPAAASPAPPEPPSTAAAVAPGGPRPAPAQVWETAPLRLEPAGHLPAASPAAAGPLQSVLGEGSPTGPPDQLPARLAPAEPAPTAGRATTTGGAGPLLRRWLLPALLGGALAALGLGVAVLVSRGGAARPPAPPPKVAAPNPRPLPVAATPAVAALAPVNPQLELAEAYVASGNLEGARQALANMPPEQQAALSAAERDRYQKVSTAVDAVTREQVVKDLEEGLGHGSLSRLNAALAGAKGIADLPSEARKDLDRARRAVALAAKLTRAQRSRSHVEVLKIAAELQQALPAYDKAGAAREQAAAAIEADADAAIEAGQFDRAQAGLDGLRAAWPGRSQLAERTARVAAQRQADAQLDGVLAAAARAEHAGQPLQGLDLLAGAKPNSRFAERFRQQRERLAELLARLDSAPPKVALREGSKLEYDKGKTARLPLRVTDDFQVKSVEAWARPEGGSYQQVPVRHGSAADYTVEVPESVHDNKTVEVYVTASDLSGHQGTLGSSQEPLKLKRKGWFSKLLGGRGDG